MLAITVEYVGKIEGFLSISSSSRRTWNSLFALPKPAAAGPNIFSEMVGTKRHIWSDDIKMDKGLQESRMRALSLDFCGWIFCGCCCCYDLLVAFGGLRWDDAGEGAAAVLLSDVLSLKSSRYNHGTLFDWFIHWYLSLVQVFVSSKMCNNGREYTNKRE